MEKTNIKIFIDLLCDIVGSTGFWSIWYQRFSDVPEIRKALVEAFPGTALNCFDLLTFELVPRNPHNAADPI